MIKIDIDMPKTCAECYASGLTVIDETFFPTGTFCPITGSETSLEEAEKRRMDDCPLEEVEE